MINYFSEMAPARCLRFVVISFVVALLVKAFIIKG